MHKVVLTVRLCVALNQDFQKKNELAKKNHDSKAEGMDALVMAHSAKLVDAVLLCHALEHIGALRIGDTTFIGVETTDNNRPARLTAIELHGMTLNAYSASPLVGEYGIGPIVDGALQCLVELKMISLAVGMWSVPQLEFFVLGPVFPAPGS